MTLEMILKYMSGALTFLLVWIFRRVFTRLDDLDQRVQTERSRQDERYQGVQVALTRIDLVNQSIEELSRQFAIMDARLEKLMEKVK